MARWDPGAQDRLRRAALDLYLERGFENVTAAEIAERAGLARRTFFRYFADKREVLFAGSEQLAVAVGEVIRDADDALSPLDAVLQALPVVGERLTEYAQDAGKRRAVIAASPELQERERTKMAAVVTAIVEALRHRGVSDATAGLLAQVGAATFQAAFARWADQAGGIGFEECFQQAIAELRSAFGASEHPRPERLSPRR